MPGLNYFYHQILIFNNNKISETKVRQESEISERKHKPWQSTKKSECVSQNQWHIPDVTPKTQKEVMYSLKGHTVFSNTCLKLGDNVGYCVLKCLSHI